MISFGCVIEAKGETPSLIDQVHGNTVVNATQLLSRLPADALWTDTDSEIYIFTADCLPILFHGTDPKAPVAAAHAGWRGALAHIARSTREAIAIPTAELQVWLGPSLKACCFAVREDFTAVFQKKGFDIAPYLTRHGEKTHFDLVEWVIQTQLKDLSREQLTIDRRCTYCSPEQLPSFRRNGSTDPRIKSWIRRAR
ncbi:MAG: polyphenol oxidase family protein [Deltaproteobacteria bacterium]|nr:polyphenol oxidase family protein [Deltaproteobacteria bacterium]MBI3294294.1 polyphenol oxidase family protein [Deltaproteobacteria bacterium]